MMPSSNDVKEAYETADQFAREVGERRSLVSIPAHNELRYAGHHFMQSVGADDAEAADLRRKSFSHCQRAMYEAAEAGIMSWLKEINTFKNDYRHLVVSSVVPNYAMILTAAKEAQAALARGRSNRNSVEEHAEEYMGIYRNLLEYVSTLDSSRDDLNATKRKEDGQFRRFVVTTALSAFGVLATILLILLRLASAPG